MTAVVLRRATVVDPRDGSLAPGADVLVDGPRISAVGPDLAVPADAVVVDASGRFVVPGYNDMHAHPLARGTDPAPTLELMLTFGITGYRQMSGSFDLLAQRAAGTLRFHAATPALLAMPGPLLTPMNAGTEERAVATVAEQVAAGADFIKAAIVSTPQFFAAQAEAVRLGIPIVGHLPSGIDVEEASRIGMRSIEHFGSGLGLLACCSTDEDHLQEAVHALPAVKLPSIKVPGFLNGVVDKATARLVARIVLNPVLLNKPSAVDILEHAAETFDEDAARALARHFVADGTWQVPTLIRQKTSKLADSPQFPADPDLRYMSLATRKAWDASVKKFEKFTPDQREAFAASHRVEYDLARIFDDEGVKMMVGTDSSGAVWVVPGAALHDEIDLLAEAGIPPLRLLQMLTTLPAEFLGASSSMGAVEAGKDADLVVLDGNPLLDPAHLHAVVGVMRAGNFYDESDLAGMQQRLAAARVVD